MPAVTHQDEPGIALHVGRPLDLFQGLVKDPLIERLPFHIHALESLREGCALDWIVAQEKTKPVGSITDTARCIEPRPEYEAHVPGANLLAGKTGCLGERVHAGPAALAQKLETMLY
jgi:hypothetical protein